MGNLVQSTYSYAVNFVVSLIPTEVIDQKILANTALIFAGSFVRGTQQKLDTLLDLKNRLDSTAEKDDFTRWINEICPEDVATLNNFPRWTLLKKDILDLAQTVTVVTAYFFTQELSLHSSLTTIFSQSKTIAKVALPLLNQIPAAPYIFSDTRIILLTAVVLKFTQMVFSQLDLKILEDICAKLGNMATLLLNIRFLLVCLSRSSLMYTTMLEAIIVNLPYKRANKYLGCHVDYIVPHLNQWVLPYLLTADKSLTCSSSLGSVIQTIYPILYPPNTSQWEKLFNKINTFQAAPNQLENYKTATKEIEQKIWKASFSDFHQETIEEFFSSKKLKILKTLIFSDQFSLLAHKEILQEIYRLDFSFWSSIKDFSLLRDISLWEKLPLVQDCTNAEQKLEEIGQTYLTAPEKALLKDCLAGKLVERLNTDILPLLETTKPFTKNNEKSLRILYGKNGVLQKTSSKKEHLEASNQFLSAIFLYNLNWYVANQSKITPEQQKQCEYLIYNQAIADGAQISSSLTGKLDSSFTCTTTLLQSYLYPEKDLKPSQEEIAEFSEKLKIFLKNKREGSSLYHEDLLKFLPHPQETP